MNKFTEADRIGIFFIIVLFCALYFATLHVSLISSEDNNICELYGNSNATLMLPERIYVIDNISISEEELKTKCIEN